MYFHTIWNEYKISKWNAKFGKICTFKKILVIQEKII
jgi:hypothetical protein